MVRHTQGWMLLLSLALPSLTLAAGTSDPSDAIAQDDGDWDDFDFEDGGDKPPETSTETPPPPPVAPEELETGEEDDEDLGTFEDRGLDLDDEEEEEIIFEDEKPEERGVAVEGQDSPSIYRSRQAEIDELDPDEQVMAWEAYLGEYPNSLFRDRIQERMDELLDAQYATRTGGSSGPDGSKDASRQEIGLTMPVLLEPTDPRTRLRLRFEWGPLDWVDLQADGEIQLLRSLSVHGGIVHRLSGWSVEPGVRWAFIKSSRTRTVVSLLGDLRLNTDPFFFGVRPMLSFGQVLGPVQIQLQAGVDAEFRRYPALHLVGGAHVVYRFTKVVGAFVETRFQAKNFGWQGGPFTFDVLGFGLKFYPKIGKRNDNPLEVDAGASVPYAQRYWQTHFGAIEAQGTYTFSGDPLLGRR